MAIAFVASSTASSDTATSVACNYPSGTASGDYVVAVVYAGDFDATSSGTSTATTPSGWAKLEEGQNAGNSLTAFGRAYSSGSSETFAYTQSGQDAGNDIGISVVMQTFSGAEDAGVSAVGPYSPGLGNAYSTPAVTMPSTNCVAVRACCAVKSTSGGGTISWTSSTEIVTVAPDLGDRFALTGTAYRSYASAGDTGAESATAGSTSWEQRFSITVGLQEGASGPVDKPASDTGSGADTATKTVIPNLVIVADTGSAVDTAPAVSCNPVATDTCSGLDVATGGQKVPAADTGSGADTATKVASTIKLATEFFGVTAELAMAQEYILPTSRIARVLPEKRTLTVYLET